MALSLQTIINFTETPFKLKLLAGRQGLKKNVSWVCYTEDKETIEFIRGNELAITLGVNYERSQDNLGIHSDNYIFEYLKAFVDVIIKAKPSTVKGIYVKNISISSTMGPGIKIDINSLDK